MSHFNRKGSATRPPKAIQENRTPLPSLSGTHRPPALPYPDTCRPASGHAETLPAAWRERSRSEGMPRGSVPGSFFASGPLSAEQKASIERKIEFRRRQRLYRAMRANPPAWHPTTLRGVIEFRVRAVMRLAPLPVQRLVEHIYPRFSPYYVMPLDEFTKGRWS